MFRRNAKNWIFPKIIFSGLTKSGAWFSKDFNHPVSKIGFESYATMLPDMPRVDRTRDGWIVQGSHGCRVVALQQLPETWNNNNIEGHDASVVRTGSIAYNTVQMATSLPSPLVFLLSVWQVEVSRLLARSTGC
jgi:hypothetical protein